MNNHLIVLMHMIPCIVVGLIWILLRNKPYRWVAISKMLVTPFSLIWLLGEINFGTGFGLSLSALMALNGLFAFREGLIHLRYLKKNKPLIGNWYL